MAIGRSRYAPPYMSTKGHSVLKQRSYSSPRSAPTTTSFSRASAYDTRTEERFLTDRVNNVNFLSNTLMDEGYDTAVKSRGRDQQLLKEATNAIPHRSLRDTVSLTSSAPSFGARRLPRRFGRAGLRKKPSTSLFSSGLPSQPEEKIVSTSDLMASRGPAPLGTWRRYGRAQSSSAARSYLEEDDASPDTSPYPSRASSVGPLLSSDTTHSLRFPKSYSPSRRRPPPFPVSSVSESRVMERSSKPWGQSVSPSLSNHSSPTRLDYEPLTKEYEPDIPSASLPRRRQRVLASSRRPAGNYYQRLLKKRSKKQGRFGPYYDVESIEGSDLSGVLSDVDSFDGTYDYDNENESSSVSPSSSRYLSTALSPYSPYFVDQDTEFVPFKPSRPLLTKGLLEITPHESNDDDSENSNSHTLPSPTTDLSLSRYLPSSLVSAATSTSSSDLPRFPYRSVVPYNLSGSDDSLAVASSSSSSPSQQILDSLVATAVQRAKSAIDNLAIPEYSGASLVLSVEGAGMSPEGKRVDFTYTPPPIPLYGRTLSLNDKLLGIQPSASIKPLDNFISGYIQRMGALRAELTGRWDKDKEKRSQYGLKPLDTGPSTSSYRSSTYTPYSSYTRASSYTPSSSYTRSSSYTPYRSSYTRSYTPSYTQSHSYVPVKDLSSKKLEHLPVTTFRRRQDDGQTQRLDVFSLGEFRPRLSSSTERAITIPESATGGHQLSVLDKINIKAAIIASKMEPDPLKRRRPRSEYAANKYRELRKESLESSSRVSPQSKSTSGSSSLAAIAKARACKRAYKLDVAFDNLEAPAVKPRTAMKQKSRFLGKGTDVPKFPGPYDPPQTRLMSPTKKTVRFQMPEFEDDEWNGGDTEETLDTSGVAASTRPVSDLRRRIRRTLNRSRVS